MKSDNGVWVELWDWLSYDVDECAWDQHSLTPCEVDTNRLVHLALFGNELTGELPRELGLLTSLHLLDLDTNAELGGSIPSEIGLLTNLNDVWLSAVKMKGAIPSEVGLLSAMTLLYLHGTPYSGTTPLELFHLEELRHVKIFKNSMTGTIPDEIGMLTKLEEL